MQLSRICDFRTELQLQKHQFGNVANRINSYCFGRLVLYLDGLLSLLQKIISLYMFSSDMKHEI